MKSLKKNFVQFALFLVMLLVFASLFFTFRNNQIINNNIELQKQTADIKQKTQSIVNYIMHGLDLGVRGFSVTKQEVLLSPYKEAILIKDSIFRTLKVAIINQNYPVSDLNILENEIDNYIKHCQNMVSLIRKDSTEQFKTLFKEDRGTLVWEKSVAFSRPLYKYQEELIKQATIKYENAINGNKWIQILLLIIGLPTLVLISYNLKLDKKNRKHLLFDLEKNNKKYLFNPGSNEDLDNIKPQQIIDFSINNFQKATNFISNISKGNYEVTWDGLNEENSKLNEENLAGILVKMREEMKHLKIEEIKRAWTAEGLADFSELIRKYQNNLTELSDEVIKFLIKLIGAQQGSLYTLKETENDAYLEMTACYALNRKKYLHKRIEFGEGIVGQTFLEGQTTLLKDIPEGYISIKSGLGDATPKNLIVIPMMLNNKVEAVMELASFKTFEDYQISFLEKVGEYIASEILSLNTTEKMKDLLEKSQKLTEQMISQEEEMRQNMEEMRATQEALQRKEKEMQQEIDQSN